MAWNMSFVWEGIVEFLKNYWWILSIVFLIIVIVVVGIPLAGMFGDEDL